MNNFICKKCGSNNYFLKEVQNGTGVATGLYCQECKTWHKWLGKKEVEVLKEDAMDYMRISSHSISEQSEEIDFEEQISQLQKAIEGLKILRDKMKALKEKNTNISQEDDVPPWD